MKVSRAQCERRAGFRAIDRSEAVLAGAEIGSCGVDLSMIGRFRAREVVTADRRCGRACGRSAQLAHVVVWSPPDRLVFTWEISPDYEQIETDPDRMSEVEVRFVAETPERTRVTLEHRHIDRHGDGWQELREGVGSDGGWPLYLARYAEQVASSN